MDDPRNADSGILELFKQKMTASGTSVTAQPPPPAPVSFVLSANGASAAVDRIASNDGCETPNVARCWWFSVMSDDIAARSSVLDSSGSARARRASSLML